jgi:outer membrane biosynthesis protein TonB
LKRKIIIPIFIIALLTLSTFTYIEFTKATTVFSDDFSSGNFSKWTSSYNDPGTSQNVANGAAHFFTPKGGNGVYVFEEYNGSISTVNSVITVSSDVYMPKVPKGFTATNGAIFFLSIADVTGENNGNLEVGIDGSDVWSLYLHGWPIFNYVFQTAGAKPADATWYHVVLTADNAAQTATVAINGTTVINVSQQEFTDKTHTMSLIIGYEDFCNDGTPHEVDYDNVQMSISDASSPTPTPTPTATPTPTPSPTPTTTPTPTATPTPTPSPSSTPTPTASPTPTVTPSPSPTPTPTSTPTPTATPIPTPTPTPVPLTTAVQVKANVTVTSVNFQTSYRLYVTINKNGVNQIEATIAKTTLPNITSLRFYINNVQKTYTYIDNGNSWTATVITT